MLHLQPLQWLVLALGAGLIGLSKTGIAGLGIVAVALFAIVLPAKVSVGIVLPVLICGDIVAVTAYRRNAVWAHLWALFPWAALGVVLGYFAMGHINDRELGHLIGFTLIVLVALQFWRSRNAAREETSRRRQAQSHRSESDEGSIGPVGRGPRAAEANYRRPRGDAEDGARRPTMARRGAGLAKSDSSQEGPHMQPTSLWLAAVLGILAGFTTMVANAAGPIMILYLLAMRLPKIEFIGTAAWYFMCLNLFKVPFSIHLGLINPQSIPVDCMLAPCAVAGAILGRVIIGHIRQQAFEELALLLTLVAAIKLLF